MSATQDKATVVASINASLADGLRSLYETSGVEMALRIVGTTPLLMNSPAGMQGSASRGSVQTSKKDVRPPAEQAETLAYRDSDGLLILPARCIHRSLTEASKQYRDPTRKGNASLTRSFVSGVRCTAIEYPILDPESGEPLTTYSINQSRVTYGTGKSAVSVVKARPEIPSWAIDLTVAVDPNQVDPGQVMACAVTAGKTIGVLDWRPEKGGQYGMFVVETAEVVE